MSDALALAETRLEICLLKAKIGALTDFLVHAPCTCPERDTSIGAIQAHETDFAGCFANQARKIIEKVDIT